MDGKRKIIVLAAILILASALRLFRLGAVPASPDWDEAALGYNAYSVLKTGMDEYGTKLPLSLRSFDDYKPPLYMYLTVPSVAVFGLSVFSTRLPSAIAGILAVAGVYLLVSELLGAFSERKTGRKSDNPAGFLPVLTAFLLAVSPWHLQFSRIAFEANIGVTLNIWGVALYLRGLRERKFLPASAFLLALALYAYHSERLFVPLLGLLLAALTWKRLIVDRKSLVVSFIVGGLVLLPMVFVFLNPTTLTRLKGTSSLADQTGLLAKSVGRLQDDLSHGDRWGLLFDNRRVVWVRTLAQGYLSHYSLKWLFLNADNPRHHAPDMGLMYLVELPFLLWGMVAVWKRGGALSRLLFGWLLLAPVAASPTTELPHAIRTLVFLPSLQIFTAIGLTAALGYVRGLWPKYGQTAAVACALALFGLGMFNMTYYMDMYYSQMDREISPYWQYGYEQAVRYAEAHAGKYRKVVVSTKLEQPHMFFLFYTKYDPSKYLAEGGTASGGFREVKNKFGKYEFRTISWDRETKDGTVLYIAKAGEIPGANLDVVKYLDGSPAIAIADR